MTDLEMTRLCAEAIGQPLAEGRYIINQHGASGALVYDPLQDDAQAMALVKKMRLEVNPIEAGAWGVGNYEDLKKHGREEYKEGFSEDLNRAIVECVARMQAARGGEYVVYKRSAEGQNDPA